MEWCLFLSCLGCNVEKHTTALCLLASFRFVLCPPFDCKHLHRGGKKNKTLVANQNGWVWNDAPVPFWNGTNDVCCRFCQSRTKEQLCTQRKICGCVRPLWELTSPAMSHPWLCFNPPCKLTSLAMSHPWLCESSLRAHKPFNESSMGAPVLFESSQVLQ